MAYELQSALIAGVSALVGGTLGTVGTLLAGRSQYNRDTERSLRDEGRQRSRESALALTELVTSLAKDIADDHRTSPREDDSVGRERRDRIRRDTERMSALIGDLPDPWRARLAEGWRFLHWSEEMSYDYAGGGTHYQSCRAITYEVSGYMRLALGAFLRNESDPPRITKRWLEYRQSQKEAEEDKRWEFAQEIAEDDDARTKWLAKRPEVAAQLEVADLPEYITDY